jgi:hypothetical protein
MTPSSPALPAAKNPSPRPICPAALDWLLTQLSATTLCEAIKSRPLWNAQLSKGGFQMTPQTISTPAMRDRLRKSMLRNPAWTDELLQLACTQKGPWNSCCELLELFGPEWILDNWRLLLETLPDPRPFILAMTSPNFEASKLARLAQRLCRCPSVWEDRDPEDLAENPWVDFAKTVLPMEKTPRTRDDNTASSEERGQAQAETDQNREKLKHQIRELKNQTKELTKALEQERAKTRELDHDLREQRYLQEEARQTAAQAIKDTAEQHQQELTRREDEFERRLEQEIQAFKQQFLGLTPDDLEQIQKRRVNHDSLLQQVEAAIENQLRLNEKHGRRSLLEDELDRLEKAEERINTLLADSIVVDEELRKLIPELKQRHEELSDLLSISRPAYQPAYGLPQLITAKLKSTNLTAADDDFFQHFQDLIRLAAKLEIIPQAEADGLDKTVASRIQQKHLLEHSSLDKTPPKDKREIWSIMPFLAEVRQKTLVIDGYNAIKCSKYWANIEQKYGLDQARKNFLDACKRKRRFFREWMIVFDGNDPLLDNVEKDGEGMTIAFAAQKSDAHNADDFILRYLRRLPPGDHQVWLVTGDYGLRREAEPFCQAFVTTEALEDFLHPDP